MRRFTLLIVLAIVVLGGVWMYRRFMQPPRRAALWQNVPDNAALWVYTSSFTRTWKGLRNHPLWEIWQKSPHLAESFQVAKAWDSLLHSYSVFFDWFGDRAVLVSLHLEGSRWESLYLLEAPFLAKVGDWRSEMARLAQQLGWSVQLVEKEGYTLWKVPQGYLAPAGTILAFSESAGLLAHFLRGRSVASPPWDWSESLWEGTPPSLHIGWQGNLLVQLFGLASLEALCTLRWGECRLYLAEEGLSLKGQAWPEGPLWEALAPLQHGPADITPITTGLTAAFAFQEPVKYYQTYLYPQYQADIRAAERWLGLSFQESFIQHLSGEVVVAAVPEPLLLLRLRDAPAFAKALSQFHKRLKARTPLRDRPLLYRGYPLHHIEVKGLFRWLLGRYFTGWEAPYFVQVGDWVGISQAPKALERFIDANIERRYMSEKVSLGTDLSREKSLLLLYLQSKSPDWLSAFLPPTQAASWRAELKPWESAWLGLISPEKDRLRYQLSLRLASAEAPASPALASQTPAVPTVSLEKDSLGESFQEEYYSNGVLKKRALLIGGTLEGEYVEYHSNGVIKVQGYYEQGRKVGTWRYYDKKGELLREETWSADSE